MPIATFHLVEGRHTDQAISALLVAASRFYAQVLDSPLERVRAYARVYRSSHVAVAGKTLNDGSADAPFFEFIVLAGRPAEQRRELLEGFTSLIVQHLGSEVELIRGRAVEVEADDWAIGGVLARYRRHDEILMRSCTLA